MDTIQADLKDQRCVVVLDHALPPGRAANAAAVIALTLGKRHPHLTGTDLIDGSGYAHPGLIPIGITVLGAPAEDLRQLREKALGRGIDVITFPIQGQQTTDYAAFGAELGRLSTSDLCYLGIGLLGLRKSVNRVIGKYGLFDGTLALQAGPQHAEARFPRTASR